jgi:integrase
VIRVPTEPLTELDMAVVRADLHTWSTYERQAWVLLASTGARLFEVCDLDDEDRADQCRVIALGKAGETKRRVVIPACAEPFLPPIIDGPLLPLSREYLEKRLRARLKRLGLGEGKRLPSLRLRAEGRLKQAETPDILTDLILGRSSLAALVDPPPVAAISRAINTIGIGAMPD